jgi:hypothetical protein
MCDFAGTRPMLKPAQKEIAVYFVALEVLLFLVACYSALYPLPNPLFI